MLPSRDRASIERVPLTSGVYRDVKKSRDLNYLVGQFRNTRNIARRTTGENIFQIETSLPPSPSPTLLKSGNVIMKLMNW